MIGREYDDVHFLSLNCVYCTWTISVAQNLCAWCFAKQVLRLSSHLLSNSIWDFTTTWKGCWQFYITLNIFLWYTVYIYFNLLVRHYFCMFMYDLSWKNVESFIGCLQFLVMGLSKSVQYYSWPHDKDHSNLLGTFILYTCIHKQNISPKYNVIVYVFC